MVSQMEDFTTSRAFASRAEPRSRKRASAHDDVDHLMIYDAFAHLPHATASRTWASCRAARPAASSGTGTRARAEAPAQHERRRTCPTRTTGMYGMFALQESVRQVRGSAPAQVPDVHISVAHGVGGMFAAAGTVVLADAPGPSAPSPSLGCPSRAVESAPALSFVRRARVS